MSAQRSALRAPTLEQKIGSADLLHMTGDDIKQIREALDLTQTDMARALGMSRRKYWSIEASDETERRDWLAIVGLWVLRGKSLQELGLDD